MKTTLRFGSLVHFLLTGLLVVFQSVVVARVTCGSDRKIPTVSAKYSDAAGAITIAALGDGQAYGMVAELTNDIGPRLSGSPGAAAAVEWGRRAMLRAGLENVRLQPVMVPHWVRGETEDAGIVGSPSAGNFPLNVCALGGSVATPEEGITGRVVEVRSLAELCDRKDSLAGTIVFFNRPMETRTFDPFEAYGDAVDQRGRGAVEAAKVGAAAVLVRSMTTRLDDVPHTGGTWYDDTVPGIPAAAISTRDADLLHRLIEDEGTVTVQLRLSCEKLADVASANVIGEIVGSERPREVIVVGAHLDCWDKGQGAHDDAAGCAQAIEALRLLKRLQLVPKRTIRCVLFMNEENGSRGATAYADAAEKTHIAAIESDRGGFAPRGFEIKADARQLSNIVRWSSLFESIGADDFRPGYGGVDIDPLNRTLGIPTLGLYVEPHRYFDYHHSASDTFDKVNERELSLGAAGMAILAYVLANEGS